MLRWPLREGLVAYAEKLRAEALEDYRFSVIVAALRHAKKLPSPPPILKD